MVDSVKCTAEVQEDKWRPQFGENREVIRWQAEGNRDGATEVRKGYYQVENVILVVSWEIYVLIYSHLHALSP